MEKLEPKLKYSTIDVFMKDDKGNDVVDPKKDRQAKLEQDALNRNMTRNWKFTIAEQRTIGGA